MTLTEKIVETIEGLGWSRDRNSRTTKRVTYCHPEKSTKLYLGKNAALRYGLKATESHSIGQGKDALALIPRYHARLK